MEKGAGAKRKREKKGKLICLKAMTLTWNQRLDINYEEYILQ